MSINYLIYIADETCIINYETMTQHNETSKQEQLEKLSPLQYKVTQEEGTEPPFNNEYHDNKEDWIYVDIVDGTPLYSSVDKYDSWTWWPSFTQWIDENNLEYHEDKRLFSTRTEVKSSHAKSHLGHVFPDGPRDAGWMRHCINSASLRFISVDELESEWYWEYKKLFN